MENSGFRRYGNHVPHAAPYGFMHRPTAPAQAVQAAEKAQQEQERAQLLEERARLVEENAGLRLEKERLEAENAHLAEDKEKLEPLAEAFRRQQETLNAQRALLAAVIERKRATAAAMQAEIFAVRHSDENGYARMRNGIATAWAPTAVKLSDCPVHVRRLAPGQSVLLENCLHTICRECTPHMVQPDHSVRCPICQVDSHIDRDALPPHPFIEAELAAGENHECVMCQSVPEEDRMPATLKCTGCAPERLLCEGHAVNHRIRMPTHAIAPLPHGGAALRCATHDRPLAAYCTNCRALICLACFASTHPAAAHTARLLTDTEFVEGIRARLVEGVAVARTVAEALIDHAADATIAVTELNERDATIASEIDRTINVLIGILERRRAVAHDQRQARTRDERAALQTTREESEYHWRIITSAADLAEQLAAGTHLGVNATAVMVQLEAAATARLHAVLELAPERSIPPPAILRFHFDESLAEQLTSLGEVVQDAP